MTCAAFAVRTPPHYSAGKDPTNKDDEDDNDDDDDDWKDQDAQEGGGELG